jgi:hypothetical protein
VAYDPDNGGVTTISASILGVDEVPYYNRQIAVTAPAITLYANTLGSGLQFTSNTYGFLGAASHGGVRVWIKSADPAMLLVAPDQSTVGSDSMYIDVPNGQQYFYYNLQALDHVADAGPVGVQLTARAQGFTPGAATTTIRPAVFDVYGIPATTTTLSDSTAFYAYVGYTFPGYNYVYEAQPIRAGGQPLTVTLINDTAAVGDLVKQVSSLQVRGDTLTVEIPVGSYYSPTSVAAGGVAYDPGAPGITTISADIPGITQVTNYNRQVTVTAPAITLSANTLGSGLQFTSNTYGYLGAANHGGVRVWIKSADPAMLLVAPDQATVGSDSMYIDVPNGAQYFYYNLQALDHVADAGPASVQLTARAQGFTSGAATTTIRRPALQLENLPTTTTTLSDSSALYVQIGYTLPGYGYLYEAQNRRAGAAPDTVTVFTGTPGVGQLVGRIVRGPADTLITRGDTALAVIPPGTYYTQPWPGALSFIPLTAGTTTVTATIPGYDPTTLATRSVTVSAPGISLSETTVGSGLQKAWYGYLGASNHGGVNVTVKSSAPSVARVAPNASTPGTDSIVIFVPDGQNSLTYYVQGMEGQTGTVTTTARASGFTDGTAALNVVAPVVGIYSLPNAVSLGQPPDSVAFYAEIGIPYSGNQNLQEPQSVRAGATALTVTLSSSAPAIGELVTQTQRGGSVTVQIPIGLYYSPTTVATGGAAFKKLAQGSTIVTAAIPGFITLTQDGTRTVTVNP